ncbi:MAG: ABC transporter ATP-binding protein, partial [Bacteroidota bacterium]
HTAALDPKTASQVIRLTRKFVSEHNLTTLMVTHSMKQALELGNRTIMMHRGRIIDDIMENEKRKLTTEDFLNKFEDIRKQEKLTPEVIEILKKQYI